MWACSVRKPFLEMEFEISTTLTSSCIFEFPIKAFNDFKQDFEFFKKIFLTAFLTQAILLDCIFFSIRLSIFKKSLNTFKSLLNQFQLHLYRQKININELINLNTNNQKQKQRKHPTNKYT